MEKRGGVGRDDYFVLFCLIFFFNFVVREAKSERDQNCLMGKDSILFQFDLCQCVCDDFNSLISP